MLRVIQGELTSVQTRLNIIAINFRKASSQVLASNHSAQLLHRPANEPNVDLLIAASLDTWRRSTGQMTHQIDAESHWPGISVI